MRNNSVISVAGKHIEMGIEKYKGRVDPHIQELLRIAQLSYTPYRFNDGRILLVLPNKSGGFLYSSEQVLFEKLCLA